MQRTQWTDRKFDLDLPEGWLPDVLERLRGTPVRLADLIQSLSDMQTSYKQDRKWSIKEHIGHLSDLEELHEGRIDDFLNRKEILRAADMNNAKTYGADHNQTDIHQLLREFKIKRHEFVTRLEKLDDDTQLFKSLHPRLQKTMKPVDMAYFTAEHDDHHLASIRGIMANL